MTYKCAFCDKEEVMPKWFVIPGHIIKPNQYSVCEDHLDLSLGYYDVYPNDQERPITRHEYNE
jgi:hypothetical protein